MTQLQLIAADNIASWQSTTSNMQGQIPGAIGRQ
jgi:hypothetical protein